MNDQNSIIPVILSGGAGTRLWPLSRTEQPKQLLSLTAEETMLQLTARRTHGHAAFAQSIVVASADHAGAIEAQLDQVGAKPQALILEPAGRNTAPAIALAAIAASAIAGPDALMLVMPSDHVIADVAAFHAAIDRAAPLAAEGWLVTFGIVPTGPETGYGWIRRGDELAPGAARVDQFIEKPLLERAEVMLAAGGHYWNGGIFLFRADIFLAALEDHAPAIRAAADRAMAEGQHDGIRLYPGADSFAASPSDSIDYAVMEKADRVAVVPVDMGWSDVGSWDALHALSEPDDMGNAISGEVIAIDVSGSLALTDGPRIAMLGVSDLIVVASGNDVLILPRGRAQEIRRLIEAMKR